MFNVIRHFNSWREFSKLNFEQIISKSHTHSLLLRLCNFNSIEWLLHEDEIRRQIKFSSAASGLLFYHATLFIMTFNLERRFQFLFLFNKFNVDLPKSGFWYPKNVIFIYLINILTSIPLKGLKSVSYKVPRWISSQIKLVNIYL